MPSKGPARDKPARVVTGADVLVASGFAAIEGKRVGLIVNRTSRAGGEHLADLIAAAPNVKLAAIFAPEHGFRGLVEAGAHVQDERDARTGVPVFSLYGATRTPTRAMLKDVDLVVFDIQDIGVRFYTYISTMGLAMQAAAAARIPFVVLDRPNPLGGDYVSGFVLEPAYRSFVGQYPIPIVHGLTAGELARMIKGARLLGGLARLDLKVIQMSGWKRSMRWPETGIAWVTTSPNIPSFESALVYPGIGMVGELKVSEGRGTAMPFQVFGAPWLNGSQVVSVLRALKLPGIAIEPITYRPMAIPGVAASPRFVGRDLAGVRVHITDPAAVAPLELGMHVMAHIVAEARASGNASIYANVRIFDQIAGTHRLRAWLDHGADGAAIVGAWQPEIALYDRRRRPYLFY